MVFNSPMFHVLRVEMVFSQPWTCTFLVAKGLTTPELMANCKPKNVVPRRKRTITFADNLVGSEDEAVLLAKSGKKLKGVAIEDSSVQSLLDLRKGFKESRLESMRQEMQADRGEGSSAAKDREFEYFLDTDSDAKSTSS
ncbi:hypothetical protein Tco_0396548 [Tanacetum coccineum]